jgi:hypothetical protein
MSAPHRYPLTGRSISDHSALPQADVSARTDDHVIHDRYPEEPPGCDGIPGGFAAALSALRAISLPLTT